jgi:hypothetical protein
LIKLRLCSKRSLVVQVPRLALEDMVYLPSRCLSGDVYLDVEVDIGPGAGPGVAERSRRFKRPVLLGSPPTGGLRGGPRVAAPSASSPDEAVLARGPPPAASCWRSAHTWPPSDERSNLRSLYDQTTCELVADRAHQTHRSALGVPMDIPHPGSLSRRLGTRCRPATCGTATIHLRMWRCSCGFTNACR